MVRMATVTAAPAQLFFADFAQLGVHGRPFRVIKMV